MRAFILIFCLIGLNNLSSFLMAQSVFYTHSLQPIIKSLQVKQTDTELSHPYINLNGEKQIEILFDDVSGESCNYAYRVIHCDAHWKKSSLSISEYMTGFQGEPITDYLPSAATTTNYINYRLLLPNDQNQLLLSGNYAVEIYNEEEPDKAIATACFSVVNPSVFIAAEKSSHTDIDINKTHQQVHFSIDYKQLSVSSPFNDFEVVVQQNNRRDNQKTSLRPTQLLPHKLVYNHNRNLIFNAGNEYRRFEFLSNQFKGMGVYDVSYFAPYYHVSLETDGLRSRKSYLYDQDQNGRFFVNCSSCNTPSIESDYYIVHFSLQAPPLTSGKVYILSEAFNNQFDEESNITYNPTSGFYEKAVLLKQGLYNYQYVVVDEDTQQQGSSSLIEGDYYETENEYTIYVYYHPMGNRYDELVGVLSF